MIPIQSSFGLPLEIREALYYSIDNNMPKKQQHIDISFAFAQYSKKQQIICLATWYKDSIKAMWTSGPIVFLLPRIILICIFFVINTCIICVRHHMILWIPVIQYNVFDTLPVLAAIRSLSKQSHMLYELLNFFDKHKYAWNDHTICEYDSKKTNNPCRQSRKCAIEQIIYDIKQLQYELIRSPSTNLSCTKDYQAQTIEWNDFDPLAATNLSFSLSDDQGINAALSIFWNIRSCMTLWKELCNAKSEQDIPNHLQQLQDQLEQTYSLAQKHKTCFIDPLIPDLC